MKTKLTMIMLIAGFLCADAQPWNWQEDDSLSYAREGLSATTLDDSVFFSGGRKYNLSFVNTVDIYDVGDDTWYTNVLESTPRWWTCAVSCNGKVFFAGGNNLGGSSSFADVDIFDKETGEWTVEYLSVARNYIGATAHGKKVFFAGGFHMMGPIIYDVIDVYDTETGIWDTLYLSEPKGGVSAVAAGSKVFFAGGIIEVNVPTDVVEIYDVNTGEWSYDTLSEPRGIMAAAAYGNKVYFAGGLHSLATSSDLVDIYDLDGGWDVPQTLSHPMIVRALNIHDAIVFSGECLYINSNGVYSVPDGTIDIYYPETGQWDTTDVPDLNPARVQYACAAYKNKAYFAGGYPGGPSLTDVVNILEYDTIWVGLSESKFQHKGFCLSPNPFTTNIQIDYKLAHPAEVNISIYNNNGKKIQVLIDQYQQQGSQQLIFNTGHLPSGVYFCVLKTSDGIQTKKIIKL